MIKVLIVEDSRLMAMKLKDILSGDPSIDVVGIAENGLQGIQMNQSLKPDVITMDIHMDKMDGLEATKQIMATQATPILIITSADDAGSSRNIFTAFSYGAVEMFDKKMLNKVTDEEEGSKKLVELVHLLSRINVLRHPLGNLEKYRQTLKIPNEVLPLKRVIGIAASTGGPQALSRVLRALPSTLPCPVIIVQHIVPFFTESLVEWLRTQTPMLVRAAENGERLQEGVIYVAPANCQTKIDLRGCIDLTDKSIVDGQRPSGTALFESIAKHMGDHSLGIVLSGMGRDGAKGLKAMRDRGAMTIGQDEATCVVYGMPKVAKELGAICQTLPIDCIADAIKKWVR